MHRAQSKFQDMFLATLDRPVKLRGCECPGCGQAGDFRAPKSRDELTSYYWFCLEHVREYNAAWDYFAGMNEDQIEAHIRKAVVWDRPSWPLGDWQKHEAKLRDTVDAEFFGGESTFSSAQAESEKPATAAMSKNERDALASLELMPPVDFTAIKAQYRLMVKKHHPDANGGSAESEEKFKTINQAFAILRAIYAMESEA